MSNLRRRSLPTPRLFVVGLVVSGATACHSSAPPATRPQPAPPSAPAARPPASAPGSVAITVNNGSTLARAIHDRYAASAPRNVTFVQKTTVVLSSGSQITQTWYTAGELPGRWRVDTDQSKGGTLYLGDSTYQFTGGKLAKADTGINEILSIAFDVFSQPAVKSETMLRRMGINAARFHETTWRGTPVYVVGAERGDSTSKQIWIERDRLIPLRLLENTRQGRTEFRFSAHAQAGGQWVPGEVEQLVNGKRRLVEQLTQVRTNVSLPDALFDPKRWASAPRWAE